MACWLMLNSLRLSDVYKRHQPRPSPGWCQAIIWIKAQWTIVNWTLGKKLKWNLKRNLHIFIQGNAFENVVWEMSAILARPQCVKGVLGHLLERVKHCSDHSVTSQAYLISDGSCAVVQPCGSLLLFMLHDWSVWLLYNQWFKYLISCPYKTDTTQQSWLTH